MSRLTIKNVNTGRRDTLDESDYNQQIAQWAAQVQRIAKRQASAFHRGKRKSSHTYKRGPKAGKAETKLRTSISFSLKSDYGEVAGIAFKFPVHGIFREYGVSNGHPRGHVNRAPSDWMSGTLQRKEDDLTSIVAQYHSDKVVNTFLGIKK